MLGKYVVVLSLLACLPGWAQDHAAADDGVVDTLYELEALFIEHQYFYLPIGPPGGDVLVQDFGPVVPFRTEHLPNRFLKRMIGELDENMVPLYRLVVYEDFVSRDTVFLNADGQELYRLEPEAGYDPLLWQRQHFNLSASESLDPLMAWVYDPAHVAADFTMVPEEFYEDYIFLKQQQNLAESSAMTMMMAMSMPEAATNLVLDIAVGESNAVALELRWPSEFSDTLEIYATTNLVSADWWFAYTNITTLGQTNFVWADAETNLNQRFYVAGNADLDEDGDGLASARERFLYKTRSDLFDTDGDGLGDGWEMFYGLLPLSIDGANGTLGDTDDDGYSNLEEQLIGTDPHFLDSNSNTGTVATIRYYYDEDDRLSDFFCGSEVAQKTILTVSHNISEEVSAK